MQTSEKEMLRKEHGGQENKDASDEILYKIDIPANRYDMLCLEGIARALNIFNRNTAVPNYTVADMTGVPNMTQQILFRYLLRCITSLCAHKHLCNMQHIVIDHIV